MQEILSSDKDTQELVDLTYDSRELGRTVKNILKQQKNEEARREKEEKKRQSRVSERYRAFVTWPRVGTMCLPRRRQATACGMAQAPTDVTGCAMQPLAAHAC